jgi:nucleolar protein 16
LLSYAALGLLPSIPLPKGPSSSRSHRANLPFLPPHLRGAAAAFEESGDADVDAEAHAEAAPKVGFGRIIRDEEGNVVDIIIDEEPEQDDEQEEEVQREPVLAKTDVVKCEWDRVETDRFCFCIPGDWCISLYPSFGYRFGVTARPR